MAQIVVQTTQSEQELVYKTLKKLDGQVVPVAKIAELSGMKQSRVRYALVDLIESGRVERVQAKAFNKHYVRYSYVVKESEA